MKLYRLSLPMFLCLALGLAGCGDGDDDPGNGPVNVDPSGPGNDASETGPDGGFPDAGGTRGDVLDFDHFNAESACTQDLDCANPKSACVAWSVNQDMTRDSSCLPSCTSTDECAFGAYCMKDPTETGVVGGIDVDALQGRCFDFSFCGPGISGSQMGECMTGEWAGIDAGLQRPGYCPVSRRRSSGLRSLHRVPTGGRGRPAGSGESCILQPTVDEQTMAEYRDGNYCNGDHTCYVDLTAPQGSSLGVCQAWCDPATILDDTPGQDDCPQGYACVDHTQYNAARACRSARPVCASIRWRLIFSQSCVITTQRQRHRVPRGTPVLGASRPPHDGPLHRQPAGHPARGGGLRDRPHPE